MAILSNDEYNEILDDNFETFSVELENSNQSTDDSVSQINFPKQLELIFESVARIGGEVCRLRAEVDGLLEQNWHLSDSLKKLKNVLDEKGFLDEDDFQLACDVFDETHTKNGSTHFFKKVTQ